MAEQKSATVRFVGGLQLVAVIVGVSLLAAKGLGLGVNWLTILGVFALPGILSGVLLAVALLAALILGLVQIFDN